MHLLFMGLCALTCATATQGGTETGTAQADAKPDVPDNLYTRVESKLAADPELASKLGKPGAEIAAVHWLLGEWDVVAEVQGTQRVTGPEHGVSKVTLCLGGTVIQHEDSYPSGTQDLGFLSYSPATRIWTAVGLDSTGNAIVTRGQVSESGMVFEGDVVIIGVPVHLRQTIRREGEDAYLLQNEELGADGRWILLDTYRYTRKTPPGK